MKGEESYCDMFTSEIMVTGVSPIVITIINLDFPSLD